MSRPVYDSTVVRVEATGEHFSYLNNANGDWLCVDDSGVLTTQGYVNDAAIWRVDGAGFNHAVADVSIGATSTEIEQTTQLTLVGDAVSSDGRIGEAADFMVNHGPERLPSEYLAELREKGWVSLTCILSPSVVDDLQRIGCVDDYENESPERVNPIVHPAMTKVTVEPISLWIMREYMQTRDVKLGHPPGVSALTRDDGKREVQGWHTDFPYLWGTGDRVPLPSGDLVLGMQRNTCISEFTQENGATIFKLGSHASNAAPPAEWGITNHTFRRGYRAEHGLPYGGPDTDVIVAPAGSMVLYDSRTWHRAGVNNTDRKRGAMIQAFIPGFIIPFMDTSNIYKTFLESDAADQLTERDCKELDNLMVHKIMGPAGLFAITTDDDLTKRVRDQMASA